MYNRYIPQPDGSYRRRRVPEPQHTPIPPKQVHTPPKPRPESCPPPQPSAADPRPGQPPRRPVSPQSDNGIGFLRQLLPKDFDSGDLIVILLLLLMAGDCEEDRNNAILTLALYFMM